MARSWKDYLIIKEFPVDEFSLEHKKDMIGKFVQDKFEKPSIGGYNTEYDNELYRNKIEIAFRQLIHDHFVIGEQLREIKTWIYCQNDKFFNSVWHSHIDTSTVNAVFYIDPPEPEEGGGLELRFLEQSIKVPVQKNMIYMFPYWMDHRPLPQTSKNWRVSVNVEYMTNTRPVVKESGVIW
jgi:hypothetical protein